MSLATVLAGALLAGALFGRQTMLASAWLLALLPSYIAVNVMLVYEVWLQLLLVLALLLALRRPWRWPTLLALAGLAALATLVRPFWLLLPVLLWLVCLPRSTRRTQRSFWDFSAPSAVNMLAIQTAAVLLLLPLVVFQSMQAGQFVPISANSGVNLWIGNSANAYGGYFLPPDEISDPRNDRQVRDEVLAYALANPGHVLGLMPHKLRFLFDREYFEGIVTTGRLSESQLGLLLHLADGSYFLLLGLALASVALLLMRQQWGLLAPLLLFAYNIASYVPFFGDARFRWPVQFLLVIYAAALPALLRSSHKGTD
ncbi:MAG: hypothetical protein MUD01_20415 [Chloroflexaceae bacterium]|nr:hypothetical protein [Chloroflexaceae bacterium]